MSSPAWQLRPAQQRGNSWQSARAFCSADSSSNDELTKQAVGNIFSHIPGIKHGDHKMVMLMTCTVCDTRSAKVISKDAYEKGVVLARCPGCENLHLIADRCGWFEDDQVDVESILAEAGSQVRRAGVNGDVLELSVDDLDMLRTGQPKLGPKAIASSPQGQADALHGNDEATPVDQELDSTGRPHA